MTRRTSILGRCAAWIASASLSASAQADVLVHTTSIEATTVPFDLAAPTPKFDSGLGTLTSVHVAIAFRATVAAGVENLDASPATIVLLLGAVGEAYAADEGVFCSAESTLSGTPTALSAFDGTVDHAGASGFSVATTVLDAATGSGSRSDSTVLALYAGPPASPGTAGTRVRATDVGTALGGGTLHTVYDTSGTFVDVTITYTYTPRVTSLCFGDGSGSACPCSNESSAATGCSNSYGWGSLLSATGMAAVSADSLVLNATVPGSNTAMFFQGTSAYASGAGAVFGDGLRCLDGSVIRLTTTTGVGGVATFPTSRDGQVSIAGSVPSGETRYYQVWYRNSAEFCTEDTFNLSNALRVDWGT